jgi:transcriptional regulator with PAS, ATPase and Fis domain
MEDGRMRRVKALIERKGFFKSLLDNMQVGVIVSDHEGYIVYINDTYARFLNMDPEKEIGRHASEIGVGSRLHVVAETGVPEVNYPHQFKDRAFLVHRVPVREDGKIIAVLGLVLFDSASTASKLAEKVSFLESKLSMYEKEILNLRSTRYTMESIIGTSKSIKALKQQAIKAAATSLPVVITGESGTGKDLLAQAIHHASSRRLYPFVKVNCAAIPKELFESELFGYEKGAFTGARSSGKPGKFELANHGSVFLDEIGDLPLELQPKLLRVLEEKEFERIGGTDLISADFRLLAATNQNLETMLDENRFRKDLFYRLNVIALNIPPLRERREDIMPIATHMLKRIAQEAGLSEISISEEAAQVLEGHRWPGNARELSNVLERAVSYLEKDTIYPCDLPAYLGDRGKTASQGAASLKRIQDRTERDALRYALEKSGYNKVKAAELLGIHRSLLYKKMHKYSIPFGPSGA